MTDDAERKRRWRALRGAFKKLAHDIDYRTPPSNRPPRYVVLEREQAAALFDCITKKQQDAFAGWQSVGLDDDALSDVLQMTEKLEAWAKFLDEWYQRQLMIDALERKTIGVTSFTKTTLDVLPDERRTKLIDDLTTLAAYLRMLTKP